MPPAPRPEVTLVGGDEASGMAEMLASLLADNVRDYAGRAFVASRARGSVVLIADDREQSVTLTFGPDTVEVDDGGALGAPAVVGPWLTLADVCSGRTSPWQAMRRGELRVEGPRRPVVAAAAYALSIPASYYAEPGARERRIAFAVALASLAGALILAAVVLVAMRGHQPTEAT